MNRSAAAPLFGAVHFREPERLFSCLAGLMAELSLTGRTLLLAQLRNAQGRNKSAASSLLATTHSISRRHGGDNGHSRWLTTRAGVRRVQHVNLQLCVNASSAHT